ncbi:MAG: lipopolysaccharide heptosyltransferase I [Proteobacteria bacterium]|nr:MAG: lipopolysaccharide heptosyltransferase I [Pseudomonadota bacterium]
MDTILFVKTSSLGDVVHNMPAVTDTRRRWPRARISWLVEETFAPLARLHPGVDEVLTVATRRWRSRLLSLATWQEIAATRRQLKARAFDRIVDAQGLIRSAWLARMPKGELHGYDAKSIREPVATRFYDVRHAVPRDLHAVARNRRLAALALDTDAAAPLDYGLPRPAPAAGGDVPYAVLLHGTSRVAKEWRESDWIGLGQWLSRRGLEVVLPWGTEAERIRAERVAGAIKGGRVLPRRPLDETAAMLAGAALVAGVDTGLLHLAAAYRVPLIGIFTASDPGLTGPVGAGPIAVLGGVGQYPGFARAIEAAEALLADRARG